MLIIEPIISFRSGHVRVYNAGAYVAKFRIEFYQNGGWNTYYSGDFPAGQSRGLDIPVGACCVTVMVENFVFIAITREIFRQYFDPSDRCYWIGGTTFNPSWGEENC